MVIADLVAELGPVRQARRDAEPVDRPRRRAVGAGAKDKPVFVDLLPPTLVHPRHGVSHDMLACRFGVDRSTVIRAVGENRPLLAERGCRVPPGLQARDAGLVDLLTDTVQLESSPKSVAHATDMTSRLSSKVSTCQA